MEHVHLALNFLDADTTSNGIAAMLAGMGFVGVVIGLAAIVVSIIANWRIAEKAGYAGALSLLMLVPLVNLIVFLIFAFAEWPIQERLRIAGMGTRPPSAL